MSPAIERCIKPLVDEFSPGSFRERDERDLHRLGLHMWHRDCPECPADPPDNVVWFADVEARQP